MFRIFSAGLLLNSYPNSLSSIVMFGKVCMYVLYCVLYSVVQYLGNIGLLFLQIVKIGPLRVQTVEKDPCHLEVVASILVLRILPILVVRNFLLYWLLKQPNLF